MQRSGRTESRAIISLVLALTGFLFGLPLGLPGLILGPIAYFLGQSAVSRIDSSQGEPGGRSTAVAGWVMGVVATAVGAFVTLIWFIVWMIANSSPSS